MPAFYSGLENLTVMREAYNYNRYLVRMVLSANYGSNTVLDFGAGIGTIAIELRKRGIRTICVESDRFLVRKLQSQGFEAYESIEPIPERSLSSIYSLNVLEHVDNDFGLLLQLYGKLKPGGRLLLYVPAFDVLWSSMDKQVGHKRRYTKARLVELVEAAGFQVITARYVDSLGFVVTLLFRALGNEEGKLNPIALKVFDRWIFPVSVMLDHVMKRFAGKNLLVVGCRTAM